MSYLVLLRFNSQQNVDMFLRGPQATPLHAEQVQVPSGYTPPAPGIGSPGSSAVTNPKFIVITPDTLSQIPQGYQPLITYDLTDPNNPIIVGPVSPTISPSDLTVKGGPTFDNTIINHGLPATNYTDQLPPPPGPIDFQPIYYDPVLFTPTPLSQQPLIETINHPELNYNPYLLTPQPLSDVPPPAPDIYLPPDSPIIPTQTDSNVIPVSDFPSDPNALRDPNLNPSLTQDPPSQNYYDLPQPPEYPSIPNLFDPNLPDLFFIPEDINPEPWNFQYDNRTDIVGPQEGRQYYTPETPGDVPGLVIPVPPSFDPGMNIGKHRPSLRQQISGEGGGGGVLTNTFVVYNDSNLDGGSNVVTPAQIYISADGVNWTLALNTPFYNLLGGSNSHAYSNGLWVILGDTQIPGAPLSSVYTQILASTNALNWVTVYNDVKNVNPALGLTVNSAKNSIDISFTTGPVRSILCPGGPSFPFVDSVFGPFPGAITNVRLQGSVSAVFQISTNGGATYTTTLTLGGNSGNPHFDYGVALPGAGAVILG